MEKLENNYNGAYNSDVIYFGDNFFKGYEDAMDFLNNECGLDDCIMFG